MYAPKVVDLTGPDPNEPETFESGIRYDLSTKTRKTTLNFFLSDLKKCNNI
jgi:hypothetical protein